MSDHDWRALGSVVSRQLEPARLELHWGAQVLAAAAAALVETREDDSHTSMLWNPERESLGSQDMGGRTLYLRLRDATLQLVSEDIFVEGEFPLGGRTLEEALAWARGALSSPKPLTRPAYDMPPHPVATGALFSLGLDAAMIELASWYDNAHAALSAAAKSAAGQAGPVRSWPHHFDIATLITLEANSDPEKAKSIGLGMTPGDASYPEPYFYVTPWPYPKDTTALPELPEGGTWHTTGWVGAVLTGTALTSVRDASAQSQRAQGFLRGARDACRTLFC
ncbi:MAG TPA: hypothetical protein PKD61_33355 [Polyangiaceae bacterium]|nr:hypothetical protein [Polyangiaceae bacterium]